MEQPLDPRDTQAVERLILAYSLLADEGDFVSLGELMGEAEIYLQGRLLVSRDADLVREKFAAAVRPAGAGHRHFSTNIIISDGGTDAAVATSYFLFTETLAGDLPKVLQCGVYRDTFTRRGGVWRFAERRIVTDGRPQA